VDGRNLAPDDRWFIQYSPIAVIVISVTTIHGHEAVQVQDFFHPSYANWNGRKYILWFRERPGNYDLI